MLLTCHCSVADWSVGGATPGSPSPRPSPLGRGGRLHRLSITPETALAQRPWAKHQSDACCSLSLRERVRVRGKYSVEHTTYSISHQGCRSTSRQWPRWGDKAWG